jgi:tetratricopeptide (TPR) repeat protein
VHMRAARQLDPMSPVLNTLEGSFLLNRGLIDEARIRLNRAVDIAPEQWMVRMGLGLLRMAERRPEQGIAEFRRAVALAEGCSRPSAMLATQLAGLGQREEARAIRDELLATSRQRYLAPTSLAAVHAALGERELALAALERALSTRDTRLVYLKDDPHWASLRGEPRFKALMHTLALDRFGPGLMSI